MCAPIKMVVWLKLLFRNHRLSQKKGWNQGNKRKLSKWKQQLLKHAPVEPVSEQKPDTTCIKRLSDINPSFSHTFQYWNQFNCLFSGYQVQVFFKSKSYNHKKNPLPYLWFIGMTHNHDDEAEFKPWASLYQSGYFFPLPFRLLLFRPKKLNLNICFTSHRL